MHNEMDHNAVYHNIQRYLPQSTIQHIGLPQNTMLCATTHNATYDKAQLT